MRVTEFDPGDVQHQACPGCGHDISACPPPDLAPALVEAARRWAAFIGAVLDYPGGGADLRARPGADEWSAIEYACHVRDVLAMCARRVEITLLVDDPEYGGWDPDALAADEHYTDQDPLAVADDLGAAAMELARLAQPLPATARARRGTALGKPFTVDGLLRVALHEALHHLADARSVVPAPSA